jgi:hypothetical protein
MDSGMATTRAISMAEVRGATGRLMHRSALTAYAWMHFTAATLCHVAARAGLGAG